ncbi:MAG: M20/M25/M40 family metallo-hydrolase [Alphaproteobacteria bacterium]|nr:M20/M25/M40 family metallo-hydrolase [Alphaproteobacteria bacterium]MBU1516925.1 M20/M25/M40 family metallo-hydrolase [Alphaproteobacteria bacterium]MBU2095813.1 M20/M25/M40 family metallo-hydrolase [Alphaproteobacteria bacterium]MBU2152050.1 M20/M25/M40 family metallo-hydrolase [Alphaproteobacteria bacterium]MBU2309571.1 M20/M25/M40 family metallo-hydrolase [Alphaproteobacteria bacterium]
MRASAVFAALAALALASPVLAAPPKGGAGSAAERKMVATVEADHARNLKLLEDLVRVNSGTMNLAGVERVGQMLRPEFEQLGFQVTWIPMAKVGRAGHLVATHNGDGKGKRILLIGHLDTVFEPDSPFQGWKRDGNIVEGPGVGDMKGGDVIIVAALRAMQAAGTLKAADITVMLTGDEEKPGEPLAAARADLIAAGRASDVALDFEGLSQAGGKDVGSIARRSSTSWTITTRAKSGHSSGVCKAAGCGAIYELARIVDEFRRELPEPNLTYNVGMILGGSQAELNAGDTGGQASGKPNVIAAEAVARGDIRTLSEAQEQRVRGRMKAIVERHLDKTEAQIVFSDDGYPPMAPSDGNKALLAKLNAVNATLGLPEMPAGDPANRGAGDISFVAFIDGLVGLGMAGEGSHAPGETADLTSLDRQAKRAALLITRLSQEPR